MDRGRRWAIVQGVAKELDTTYQLNNNKQYLLIPRAIQELRNRDFPGGPVVKNLPSNEGDSASILGQGTEIPHAEGKSKPAHHN